MSKTIAISTKKISATVKADPKSAGFGKTGSCYRQD
jgi:hypothetical protein